MEASYNKAEQAFTKLKTAHGSKLKAAIAKVDGIVEADSAWNDDCVVLEEVTETFESDLKKIKDQLTSMKTFAT